MMTPMHALFGHLFFNQMVLIAACCLVQTDSVFAFAQIQVAGSSANSDEPSAAAVRFGETIKNRWRVGAQILGGSRSCKNVMLTIPVPNQWPEQQVRLFNEEFPTEIQSADYRELNSGVRQLVVKIPKLTAKQLIEFTVTFEVSTRQILAPDNTDTLKIPTRVPRELKDYVGVSPQISYRNSKLRNQAKDLLKEKENAWDQVEAIFDWVRDNIEYRNTEPSDSLSVFRKKIGCGEDLVGLFVAMCRSVKIPARMVWVDGSQYAEFYLVDENGSGHWYPCQVAGRREFGSNVEPRVIQQKGDNIKVPEKQGRQKFCAEFMTGSGTVKPVVKFLRDLLPAE